jgi:hypothetical protein
MSDLPPDSDRIADIAGGPFRAKRRHSQCATSKIEIAPLLPRAARTLAEVDNARDVGRSHLAEALSYHALVDDVRAAQREDAATLWGSVR